MGAVKLINVAASGGPGPVSAQPYPFHGFFKVTEDSTSGNTLR